MMWLGALLIASVVLNGLLIRAYLDQEATATTAEGSTIIVRQQRDKAIMIAASERLRNRDLARENNRLKVEAKNRQRIPQDVVDAFAHADHKNTSPRLDVESMGRCVCVPDYAWQVLGRRINGVETLSTTEATRVDL